MKRLKKAFTLAEVLITLAIIGVVAAISIPSVISNSQQQEFKTGLRKAISVLNQSITMNMAVEGESPYDNADLFDYLQRHMSVMKSTTDLMGWFYSLSAVDYENKKGYVLNNAAFYTTDGMRYEFLSGIQNERIKDKPLYESDVKACVHSTSRVNYNLTVGHCFKCGSYGLSSNPDGTTSPPCMIMVDVNGDRKPTPYDATCKKMSCIERNIYKPSDPNGIKLMDIFSVMITDKGAIPYGVAAQRAMYQAQAKK